MMDDSDVERIVLSIESKYGESRTEFASHNKPYRTILLDQYLYGTKAQREQRIADGKRGTTSAKQDYKIKIGMKAYARYGRVDTYTIRAIRGLLKRGKKV